MQVKDKTFQLYISESEILNAVQEVADQINSDYKNEKVIFIGVLNGAFMFAADLLKSITLDCEISFVKVSSYQGGTASSGEVRELIGLNTDVKDKHVILLEDIVDSGLTLSKLYTLMRLQSPKSLAVATMLYKPEAFKGEIPPKYVGIEIENKFIVGYGLDYEEEGRNTRAIYQITNKTNNMLNLVLFGPPGAGKGTQSENIVKEFGIIHLSTGDVFRFNMKNDTELGKLAKSYIEKGQLVPDEVTINMLKAEVNKHDNPKGFIFDGFPRTTAQAEALDEFLSEKGASISGMIALEVPEDELKERLRKRALDSGRTDDADPTIIANRIAVYNKETAPVKVFYQGQDKLHIINGLGNINDITNTIIETINSMK
ncbi:MAG TPA: adenylate kinase [Brumimicrobium sp.]|nr:adenylate kinase [Brumimicrobium sp.]